MEPSAQSLILDLLSTLRGRAAPVRVLVGAAGLFGITDNNMRVALARLLARGLIERNERGLYRLARGARAVESHVASWAQVEERMTAWRGGWIAVYTGGLPRLRGAAAGRRRRALDFLGMAEFESGLWLRPDNLRGSLAAVSERLFALGLDSTAPVFAVSGMDAHSDKRARSLWDVEALQKRYRELCKAVQNSTRQLARLSDEDAMVETFLLGGRVLREIAFDPLLPEAIADAATRRALIAAMSEYDRVGRGRWKSFMRAHGAPYADSPLTLRVIDAATERPGLGEVGS